MKAFLTLFLLAFASGQSTNSRSTRTLGSFFGYNSKPVPVVEQQYENRPLVYQVKYYDGSVPRNEIDKVGVVGGQVQVPQGGQVGVVGGQVGVVGGQGQVAPVPQGVGGPESVYYHQQVPYFYFNPVVPGHVGNPYVQQVQQQPQVQQVLVPCPVEYHSEKVKPGVVQPDKVPNRRPAPHYATYYGGDQQYQQYYQQYQQYQPSPYYSPSEQQVVAVVPTNNPYVYFYRYPYVVPKPKEVEQKTTTTTEKKDN